MGAGVHWEARVFGPEVMSYGARSGEVYLSDITLAFLEDSGHYVSNYTSAGRLVEGSANEPVKTSSWFASTARPATEVEMQNSTTRGPGYIRWGREAGCEFVTAAPKDWSVANKERYTCQTHKESACSPDNRMAAVCNIAEYGAGAGQRQANVQSCYGNSRDCVSACCDWDSLTKKCKQFCDGKNGLPVNFQAVMGEKTGVISTVDGGLNSAMDYMPIRLGFANCQDLTPKNAKGVVIRQGGQTIDLGDLFVETSTLMGKGGQIKGKESRCFASSLKHFVEIASGDHSYTRAGVCYRANCPTPDVLQFGLQGASGEYWYHKDSVYIQCVAQNMYTEI